MRTNVLGAHLSASEAVRAYKRLSVVERAFRSMKAVDIAIRPIHHRKADRVRAHVLICMLAYYVEWHMRRALAPMLFQDDDKARAERRRATVVAPAQRSKRAERKVATKRTDDGHAVHSFRTLLDELATLTLNRVEPKHGGPAFDMLSRPTATQARAFKFLGIVTSP